MNFANITLQVDGAVATITLNRPEKLNALSTALRTDLQDALEEVRPGTRVRVVRLTGAGRAFCSGYDLGSGESVYSNPSTTDTPDTGGVPQRAPELAESDVILDRERLRDSIQQWLVLWNYRKPIVAQVHGLCLSGALDLIGVCDLVYAGTDARFGHPAARALGIPPTMGMLPLKIGLARTKELFFTGDLIDASRARDWGVVNEVFAGEELDARTMDICRRIALNTSDALTMHKHVINRWAEIMGVRLMAAEGAEFDALFHTSPASEAFGRIASRDGIKAALAWRDDPYRTS